MGKIYFHADDYGRSEEVSKNILNCLINGNLNSVSIMINHDQKCHNKLKKLKNVNKRLHLNLTEISNTKNNSQHTRNLSFFKLLFNCKLFMFLEGKIIFFTIFLFKLTKHIFVSVFPISPTNNIL